jgi:hypothetical protein
MKKANSAFRKTAKHKSRKSRGDVVSHRNKKHVPKNHPYPEAKLSPDR